MFKDLSKLAYTTNSHTRNTNILAYGLTAKALKW